MAGRRAEGHAPWVPLHAALDPAAPQVARRRRPSRATALSALAAALLLFVFSSGGTLAATTLSPKCDVTNLRTGPGTTYAKKTSVNTGALLTLSATVTRRQLRELVRRRVAVRIELVPVQRDQRQERLVAVRRDLRVRREQAVQDRRHADAEPDQASDRGTDRPATPAAPTAEPTAAPIADPNASPVPTESPLPTRPRRRRPPRPPPRTPSRCRQPSRSTAAATATASGCRSTARTAAPSPARPPRRSWPTTTRARRSARWPNSHVRVLVLQSFAATASNPLQIYGRGGAWTIDGINKTFPADARLQFTPTVSGDHDRLAVLVTATDGSTLYSAASSGEHPTSGPAPARCSSCGRRRPPTTASAAFSG